MSSNNGGNPGDKEDGNPDPAGGDQHDAAIKRNQPLRQPKQAPHDAEYRTTPNQSSTPSWSQNDQTTVKSMSSLSIAAPVFVPRAPTTAPQQNFVGYNEFEGLQTNRPAILSVSTNEVDEIRLLKDSMFQLMSNPASFDDLLKTLTDKFNESVRDEKSLLEIIKIIYELSVEQVNFRYTGARMCHYLSRYMKVQTDSGTFRQHLLKRLHQEFQKKDENIRNSQTIPRLHGFTLFVAELFENFEIVVNDLPRRIKVLSSALIDLIHTLLQYPDDPNLKCVVNVLKLTGSNLEECEKKDDSTAKSLDIIFTKIKQISMKDDKNVSGWVREMLMKLLMLRATGWDRGSNETAPPQADPPIQPAATAQEFSNEPIFFAADGTQITAQEAGFYNYDEYDEEYYANDYEYEYQQWSNEEQYQDPGAVVLDDDEVYADYEQFLRETTGNYS